MYRIIKTIVRTLAWDYGKAINLYLQICRPRNKEYADFLRHRNFFYSMGKDCLINADICAPDPKYVRLGDNVCLSSCALIGHDGVQLLFLTEPTM